MDEKEVKKQSDGVVSGEDRLENWLRQIRQDFWSRYGTHVVIVLGVLAAVVLWGVYQTRQNREREAQWTEKLGAVLNYLYANQTDSAATALENFLGEARGLPMAKAALLLGNIKFQRGDYEGAAALYQKAVDAGGDAELIVSAAEHGLAAVAMEQKNYPLAVERLEKFVKKYGKRSGNLQERYTQKEGVDPVVTVPDALWKLTLCYAEMQQKERAKITAERLIKVYGQTRQALQARKFLATF